MGDGIRIFIAFCFLLLKEAYEKITCKIHEKLADKIVSPRTVYVRIIIVVINVNIRHPKGFRVWRGWGGGGGGGGGGGVDTFISI